MSSLYDIECVLEDGNWIWLDSSFNIVSKEKTSLTEIAYTLQFRVITHMYILYKGAVINEERKIIEANSLSKCLKSLKIKQDMEAALQ